MCICGAVDCEWCYPGYEWLCEECGGIVENEYDAQCGICMQSEPEEIDGVDANEGE